MYEKNGYMLEMSAADVFKEFDKVNFNDNGCGHRDPDEYWCVSCFGPIVDHEIILMDSLYKAFEWIKDSIGSHTVDEMCFWCWKDIYDTGTEWEIRKIKIPSCND